MLTLRVCGSPLNCLEYNQIGDMVAIGSQNGKYSHSRHTCSQEKNIFINLIYS
jgi:hypothetical protein